MILRVASIAMVLMLVAAPAQAQDNGSRQGQGQGGAPAEDFNIFNPSALQDDKSPTPPGGNAGGVFDAAAQSGVPDDDAPPPDGQAELEWVNERVVTPPPDLKPAIDAAIAADVADHAQSSGQHLGDLQQRSIGGDAQGATRDAGQTVRAIDAEFPDLDTVPDVVSSARGEMDDVSASMTGQPVGPDGRPASGTARTTRRDPSVPYEDPFRDDYFGGGGGGSDPYGMYAENGYEPIHYPARGTPDSRMSWWQQLLIKSLEGVSEGLKGLTERRANELKARTERIKRNYPEYRAYVDYESRRAIERSAFARAGSSSSNKSLDGLILGPARTGTGTTTTSPTPVRTDLSASGVRNARTITRVPRVLIPGTNEEKLILDMPLGVDANRPLR